jgi:hypothetical protein
VCGRAYSTYTAEELYFHLLNKAIKDRAVEIESQHEPEPYGATLRMVDGARGLDGNEFKLKIHDRVPVILDVQDWDKWLDPEADSGKPSGG